MTTAGIYNITAGQAEFKPDGSIVIHGLELKPAATNWTNVVELTLRDVWKSEAPFSYDHTVSELIRHNILNEDGVWIHYPIRGNHPTCSLHVRGLYEVLLSYNCLDDFRSFPKVRRVFHATFKTTLNNSKVIENKDKCRDEFDFFYKMFEAFANPDANAETE